MNSTTPPAPGPWDDEDAYDYESDYAWHEWHHALKWANRGDYLPLADLLRRHDLPLNNEDARNFLADQVVGKIKKPRKTAKRPEYVLFADANGRQFHIDKRHENIFKAMKMVHETKTRIGEDDAIKAAAKQFEMKSRTLREHLRRPRSHWGLPPVKSNAMFDSINIEKK